MSDGFQQFQHGLMAKRDELLPDRTRLKEPYKGFLREFNHIVNDVKGGVEGKADACSAWYLKWSAEDGPWTGRVPRDDWMTFVEPWSFCLFHLRSTPEGKKQRLEVIALGQELSTALCRRAKLDGRLELGAPGPQSCHPGSRSLSGG